MIDRQTVCFAFPVKPLGQMVDFLDSRRRPVKESDRQPGPFPYYGANGQQGTINDYIFDEPLVLLAEDGGYFDEPERGIAYRISGKSWVNNHAHVLRPRAGLDLNFLCRILEHYDVAPYISGTTRSKLTKAQAEKIAIPVPPLKEQRRIGLILDQADELRRKRAGTLKRLEELPQAIFLDMFGNPVTNSKGWMTAPLRELGRISTGSTPAGGRDGMFGGNIPFLTPGDLGSGEGVRRTVTAAGAAASRIVRANSALVCCIGATIGKMDKARERSAFNQQINAVEWSESVDDEYGYQTLTFFKEKIAAWGDSTTLPILKKSSFAEIKIPVPPLKLQLCLSG